MILDNDNNRRAIMEVLPEGGMVLDEADSWNILWLPFFEALPVPESAKYIFYKTFQNLDFIKELIKDFWKSYFKRNFKA